MSDRITDSSVILGVVSDILKSDPSTSGMTVEVMGHVNQDWNRAINGWVGLYINDVSYEPKTLGQGFRNFEAEYTFGFIVQAVDLSSAEAAHQKLESYVKDVIDVILLDKSVKGYVDTISRIEISYQFVESERESLHYEVAVISAVFNGRTN